MVVGISAGVGKSTFARRLGEQLEIEVFHLDAYHWKPGWVEAPREEFADAQRKIVGNESWIIEGNYSSTFDIRFEAADTIIYLELPLYLCLFRVLNRWLTNLGNTRVDMGEGCTEKMDWKFLKFIVTTYSSRKKKMQSRFANFLAKGEGRKVIQLKNKQEIKAFLENVIAK